MTVAPGTTLGPYEIVSPLGAGGMGEVYLARDTKLDRDVAIKVLPEAFSRDAERVARFQREARVLASLSHPNIAVVYGFEEADAGRFLAMEYVPGDTLTELLMRATLPVDEALQLAKSVAEAVEAAHESGVIHRDLKPGNIKIKPDGSVKVLDFGLAKAILGEDRSSTQIANSPTITADYTRPGVVLGTAAYMSPEQARGKSVDRRADIWSFGCVLYEMLAGSRPFDGQTTSDVLAKILERDPDLTALPPNTPPKIVDLIRRCLEKSSRRRLRDIGDAVLELDEAITSRAWTTSAIAAATGPIYAGAARRRLAAGAACVALGVVVGVLATMQLFRATPDSAIDRTAAQVVRLSVAIPEFISYDSVRITPDGRRLVAVGRADPTDKQSSRKAIYVRPLGDDEFRLLDGTTGVGSFCVSPDSRWLALALTPPDQESRTILCKTAVDGSTALLPLADIPAEWAKNESSKDVKLLWTTHDEVLIVNQSSNRIEYVATDTGALRTSEPLETETNDPGIRPSSQTQSGATLFNVSCYQDGAWQMKVKALVGDEAGLRTIASSGSNGMVTATGHLLYSRGQRLLAAPFDEGTMTMTAGPVAIIAGLRTSNSWENGDYSLSVTGTLVYAPGGRVGAQRHLTIVDEHGEMTDLPLPGRPMESSVSASRDGRRAAVVITNTAGLFELWITEIAVPRLRKLASEPDGDCSTPLWNRRNDYIAYVFNGGSDRDGIYRRRADGTGTAEPLILSGSPEVTLKPWAWSPDGRTLIVERLEGGHGSLHALRLDESGKPVTGTMALLLGGSYDTAGADLSPDGSWLIYGSDESGRKEIYVRSVDDDGKLGTPSPVTMNGGRMPRWSPDGNRIYYWNSGRIMTLGIDPKNATPTSSPRVAIDFESLPVSTDDFSVLAGGKLLMIRKGPDESRPTHLNVVLNWFEELNAKVPIGGVK